MRQLQGVFGRADESVTLVEARCALDYRIHHNQARCGGLTGVNGSA